MRITGKTGPKPCGWLRLGAVQLVIPTNLTDLWPRRRRVDLWNSPETAHLLSFHKPAPSITKSKLPYGDFVNLDLIVLIAWGPAKPAPVHHVICTPANRDAANAAFHVVAIDRNGTAHIENHRMPDMPIKTSPMRIRAELLIVGTSTGCCCSSGRIDS